MTKMCMYGTRYQVRVDNVLSEDFKVMTCLKECDVLSPLLFNIALEKVKGCVQRNQIGNLEKPHWTVDVPTKNC